MHDEERVLTKRQSYWLKHVRAWQASDKSIVEYSSDQDFTAQAMYAGKKELVKKGVLPRVQKPRFARAHVVDTMTGSEWRIQLPNGVSVNFSGSIDGAVLTTVLGVAAAVA